MTSKEQAKFELTDNTLISEIAKQEMFFGEGGAEQAISIAIEEIGEVSIGGSSAQNQGTRQTVDCSFTLNKKLATFAVDATLQFQYDTLNEDGLCKMLHLCRPSNRSMLKP